MKIIHVLIILFCTTTEVLCQNDTTYFFGVNGRTCDIKTPEIKKQISYDSDNKIIVETFNHKNGKWISILSEKIAIENEYKYKIQVKSPSFSKTLVRIFEKLDETKFRFTDKINKRVIRKGVTLSKVPLILNGEVIEYYKNGNKKSVSTYANNELVSNKNWLINGEHYIDSIFYSVNQEPCYKLSISILHAYVRNAFQRSDVDISQINGRIVLSFIVLENGSIDGIQIEEGLNRKLNAIACDAFRKLPGNWQPARLDGKDVRYYQLFPINFIYQEREYDHLELKGRMFNFGS